MAQYALAQSSVLLRTGCCGLVRLAILSFLGLRKCQQNASTRQSPESRAPLANVRSSQTRIYTADCVVMTSMHLDVPGVYPVSTSCIIWRHCRTLICA